jgi:hypothetical protein
MNPLAGIFHAGIILKIKEMSRRGGGLRSKEGKLFEMGNQKNYFVRPSMHALFIARIHAGGHLD